MAASSSSYHTLRFYSTNNKPKNAELTMESLTSIILPHISYFNFHSSHSPTLSNLLHFHVRFRSIPRRCPGYTVCHAIRNPKFDFYLTSFTGNNGDDQYGAGDIKGRRRKRRKSDRRSKQRRWWTEEEEDGDDDEVENGMWEQVVDSLWILQVFRSYGWFSPIILLSFLIATGPKAFLMAFSIPFGLSLLIFAYQKLQGWLEGSPKPRNRRKTKSKFGRRNDVFMEDEDGQEENQQSERNTKRDYRHSNGSFYKSQNGGVGANNFGGWDDLVRDVKLPRADKPSQETGKPEKIVEEKLSRSLEEKDLPVMLRLLIAVFPFLASWTNLL